MPHGLEYIVRPHQSPASHGAVIIPATPSATRTRATLTWGAKSTMPEAEIRDSGIGVACCKEGLTEFDRDAETVRIEQPGKPENYVDVRRAKTVTLRKSEDNKCGSQLSQMSYVAAGIDESLAGMADAVTAGRKTREACQQKWFLDNNTAAAA